MTGLITYSDTADSYAAGASNARRDALTMDDAQRAHITAVLRAYIDSESTNRFARAYAYGALDALAPLGLYA